MESTPNQGFLEPKMEFKPEIVSYRQDTLENAPNSSPTHPSSESESSLKEKLITAINSLGGEATTEQICRYFEEHFQGWITKRNTWRNSVVSRLSTHFGRRELPSNTGQKTTKFIWCLPPSTPEEKSQLLAHKLAYARNNKKRTRDEEEDEDDENWVEVTKNELKHLQEENRRLRNSLANYEAEAKRRTETAQKTRPNESVHNGVGLDGICADCFRHELSLCLVPCGHVFCGNIFCNSSQSETCTVCRVHINDKIQIIVPKVGTVKRKQRRKLDVEDDLEM